MTIIIDVAKELLGMFLADARLTMATLVLVAIVASLVVALHVEPIWCGGVLLLGCLAILVEAAIREARRRSTS
jgi:polyferredoxin